MEQIKSFKKKAQQILVGKETVIDQALCCIIAGGHLLIEDIPGVGKTTLVKILSRLLSLPSKRIQCTNDLLPADIIGGNIYEPETKSFTFSKGPIFTNLLIADELNRATPKTQSACLQAMEEGEVSVDGETYKLPHPFIIIATQNPEESIGTFPLPESQLDRFLMKIKIGYPDREFERQILEGKHQDKIDNIEPAMSLDDLINIQNSLDDIKVKGEILDYIQDLVAESRSSTKGLSLRATKDLVNGIRAWALIQGRNYCIPDDVKHIFPILAIHRLGSQDPRHDPQRAIEAILAKVPTP